MHQWWNVARWHRGTVATMAQASSSGGLGIGCGVPESWFKRTFGDLGMRGGKQANCNARRYREQWAGYFSSLSLWLSGLLGHEHDLAKGVALCQFTIRRLNIIQCID